MAESQKNKEKSPLVKAVLALDDYFSELERVGNKIVSMDLKSDSDFEHARRLMARFSECGQAVSTEVVNLSNRLNEARVQAEVVAQKVSARAEQLTSRRTEEEKKMDEFRVLSEKVRDLTVAIGKLRRPEGEAITDEDRVMIAKALSDLDGQLTPLIEKSQTLRKEAHQMKMKALEQNADSLTQSLQAIRHKLSSLNLVGQLPH